MLSYFIQCASNELGLRTWTSSACSSSWPQVGEHSRKSKRKEQILIKALSSTMDSEDLKYVSEVCSGRDQAFRSTGSHA